MKGVKWFVIMVVVFNMVAGLSAMPGSGDAKATDHQSTFSITKLAGAVPKLTKDNYHLWLASILTVLMGGAMHAELKRTFALFKEHCEYNIAQIKAAVCSGLNYDHTKAEDVDKLKELNGSVFQVVFLTISEGMTSLRNYAVMKTFEQGFELLKHIYDNFGTGGSTNQVLKSFNIMAEKQALGEAPSEFANRLDTLNADLKVPLGDDQLKTILTRGVHDNWLVKWHLMEGLIFYSWYRRLTTM